MTWNAEVKTDTKCVICNTPLAGYNLKMIGGKYYCSGHYEKNKPETLRSNALEKKKGDDWDNFYESLI